MRVKISVLDAPINAVLNSAIRCTVREGGQYCVVLCDSVWYSVICGAV
jgi:hypothetical protein